MNYRHCWSRRVGMPLIIAAALCWSPAAEAGGHGSGWQPQGPIFKTLDALAGGIESVLRRTGVTAGQRAACDGIGCDAIRCDDGCDHTTLRQLEGHPLPSMGHGPSVQSKFQAAQPLPRSAEPLQALPRVPTDRSDLSAQDSWIDSFVPSPPSGQSAQPPRVAPRSPASPSGLPNPFLDDPQSRR
jgi:hypothetical protein